MLRTSYKKVWHEIGENKSIVDIIEPDYEIPFASTPSIKFSKISILQQSDTIDCLLETGSVVEPFSVASNSDNKHRRILVINNYVFKVRISLMTEKL